MKAALDRSRILKFQGVLKDQAGERVTGIVSVVFAIYEQKEGGAPLWEEVQNVEADVHGRFFALVGSTQDGGISPELFGTETTRWIGMQVPLLAGEPERPRIRLVSTADGLILHRATRLVIPGNPGDQTGTAEQQSPGETTASQDQSGQTSGLPRASRRSFHPDRQPVR